MDAQELEKISNEILDVNMIIETVRDACIGTDIANYETVLNIAIQKQGEIYDKIELMY